MLITPIMHESVNISAPENISGLVTFLQSTKRKTSSSPAGWFRQLHVVVKTSSEHDDTESVQLLDQMHLILLYATELRELILNNFWITNTTLTILDQSCARTLTILDLGFNLHSIGHQFSCDIIHIGALVNLQELTMRMETPSNIVLCYNCTTMMS
jgi:hypothetical protein